MVSEGTSSLTHDVNHLLTSADNEVGLKSSSNQLALKVSDAYFSYGNTIKSKSVLCGLNMNVMKGEIYALLGPSGCGKSAAIKCITKSNQLDSGQIQYLHNENGSLLRIPGCDVGYMPQELALFPDLTVQETLYLFGRINGVAPDIIEERIETLLKTFHVTTASKIVSNLSGGQKRKVSLMTALLHNPPMLILDEPTVEIDPILRKTIWNYFIRLANVEGKTIILTTHYISEAKFATTVGLMRNGVLLSECSPLQLLQHFNDNSLESCFYKICEQEDRNVLYEKLCPRKTLQLHHAPSSVSSIGNKEKSTENANKTLERNTNESWDNDMSSEKSNAKVEVIVSSDENFFSNFIRNVTTLTKKNLNIFKRNFVILLFQFGTPAVVVTLFTMTVGSRLFDLPIVVVNEENPPHLSARFLKSLEDKPVILRHFKTLTEGKRSVELGQAPVVLHIQGDFSECLMTRLRLGVNADNFTLDCASIKMHMDATNHVMVLDLQQLIWKSYESFEMDILDQLGASRMIASMPLSFQEPVYGSLDIQFTDYVAPCIVLFVIHYLASVLTCICLLLEKISGVFQRLIVNGVTRSEIFSSQLTLNVSVVLVQVTLVLIVQFGVLGIRSKGSIALVVILIILQGICGMLFGLFASALANDINSANLIGLSFLYPNTILCGLVWPLEGMPIVLRYLAYFMPVTMPAEALRSILSRGWGLDSLTVWLGLLNTAGWSTFFLVAALLIFRSKK